MGKKPLIVTIGREYGSGGRRIGKLLADKMQVPFYDKEILTQAARDSGICEELFESHDEKTSRSQLLSVFSGMNAGMEIGEGISLNQRIFLAQFETIHRFAEEGSCVIVGRCGDYVLKNRGDVLSIFIYASPEARIERIMRIENLASDKARERMRKMDKQRKLYYEFFADGNWGKRENYHLMLRADGLEEEAAAETLCYFAQKAGAGR